MHSARHGAKLYNTPLCFAGWLFRACPAADTRADRRCRGPTTLSARTSSVGVRYSCVGAGFYPARSVYDGITVKRRGGQSRPPLQIFTASAPQITPRLRTVVRSRGWYVSRNVYRVTCDCCRPRCPDAADPWPAPTPPASARRQCGSRSCPCREWRRKARRERT